MTVGIPGSGKSSWVAGREKYVICPDTIRKNLFGDISDQSMNTRVWDIAKGMAIAALQNDLDVIVDATNVNEKFFMDFTKDMPDSCDILIKFFPVEPAIAYDRIYRDLKDGKDRAKVPEWVVYRMYGEYLYMEKVLRNWHNDSMPFDILPDQQE